jgi:predicted dehydrogenase
MSLKIAIVGTGNVARSNYVPFLARQEDVDIVYLSRTRAKAEALAAEFGGLVVDTPQELAAQQPDAVLVLTRETQRADAISALLEHRFRRLFFEKPLVARHGQENVCEEDFFTARDLLRRAHDAGTETAMVFNYRFFEQTQRARRIAAEREFGNPLQVVAFSHYATWSHVIDLVHLFAGPVIAMAAVESAETRGAGDMTANDVAAAFRFENGATGTILGTVSPSFAFPLFELIINFEGGRVHMRDLDGEMEVLDYDGTCHERTASSANVSRWDHYRASFDKSIGAYLDSIRNGQPPPISGQAGLEELRFEAALRRSASERRWVDLPAEFPVP